ncbi:hypothetical protein M0R45_031363 [Rubus argutus]|uniref:Transcription factor n=1 Tax=Rubus argutus TaxID=59490 RepID=A0AAW1WGC9_RUBAR
MGSQSNKRRLPSPQEHHHGLLCAASLVVAKPSQYSFAAGALSVLCHLLPLTHLPVVAAANPAQSPIKSVKPACPVQPARFSRRGSHLAQACSLAPILAHRRRLLRRCCRLQANLTATPLQTAFSPCSAPDGVVPFAPPSPPKKVVNLEVKALFHNFHEDMDMDRLADINEDATDSEWFYFYTISLTQSFAAGHGNNNSNILGQAFCSGTFVWLAGEELQFNECERVKEARMHGIQTFVCIATPHGVLELASLEVIKEDWGFVHLSKSIFGSDIIPNSGAGVSTAKQGQVDVPQLQTGMFSGSAQKERTTQGKQS